MYNLRSKWRGWYRSGITSPPATRVEVDATYCDEHGVRVTYCTSCETNWDEGFDGTEHEWVTGTSDPIWDWDKQDFVTEEVTYCSRCHAQR